MGIDIKWDNEEKTIILTTYSGEFTWDELEAMNRESEVMLDSVDHEVDILVNLKDLVLPKNTLANFPKIAQAPSLTHSRVGLLVLFGASHFAQTLLDLLGKVYSTAASIVIVPTLEEAYEVIAEHRQARDQSA
jgi:hypothetical protein